MGSAEREIERQEKIKSALREIRLGKRKNINDGLTILREIGDESVIPPIIDLWNKGITPSAAELIKEFIGNLKSTPTKDKIMEFIFDENYKKIKKDLLETIWNSKVDYSDYLIDFLTLAIQEEFLIALECVTIIENLEGPFEEQVLLDAQLILREYAESQQKKKTDSDEKIKLIAGINDILEGYENHTVFWDN